jgi:hypothetical protein
MTMNKSSNFIESLSDEELAVLRTYKYDSYLAHSKGLIEGELDRRNITSTDVSILCEKTIGKKHSHGCPRCGSYHLSIIEVGSVKSPGGAAFGLGIVSYLTGNAKKSTGQRKECQICGLVLSDDSI